jgi:hypothetical protein
MTFRFSMVWQLLLCGAALSQVAFGQGDTGAVTGKLLDVNGNVITGTGASIHMKNTETGKDYTADILPKGDYKLSGLPPGTYELTAPMTCCMYRSYTQKSVVIKAGETLSLDLHIDWGGNLGTIGDDPVMLNNDMRAKAKNTSGPTPRMANGKPDFNGMWVPIFQAGLPPNPFPLQPWADEMQKKLQARSSYNQGPAAYCMPQSAIPSTLLFPFKIAQTNDLIVHMTEFTTPGYRQVFLDARKHPADWNPAWMGHSVGKWEGDTLVIDSVGFNEITPGFGIHTEKLHVVERWTRPDKGHLEVEITAEDPDAYTAVHKTLAHAALVPDEEVLEFVCPENNKDPLHFGGLGWTGRP